jgi:translation initiation factor 2 beta subunit (eIF-2beta)/eIF-5
MMPYMSFAANEAPLSYDAFLENKAQFCTNNEVPWIKDYGGLKTVVSQSTEAEFPRLNRQSIERSLATATSDTPESAEKIASDIAASDTSNFKLLEVARIHHREKMNKAFASAIIIARLEILSKLRKTLSSKLGSSFSEISNKLDRETEKLNQLLSTKWGKADTSEEEWNLARDRMIQTVLIEHCMYRYYLGYVRANIYADAQAITALEKSIRTDPEHSNVSYPQTISEFRQSVSSKTTAIDQEIVRSEVTLEKAVDAFKGMERTYAAHILLVIIYDDYVRLRQNLITYMNANTQFFEKSYNAQNVNQ